MKLSNVMLLSAILASAVGMSAVASAAQRPAGVCTFIYSPVPYVTKDGKKSRRLMPAWQNGGRFRVSNNLACRQFITQPAG